MNIRKQIEQLERRIECAEKDIQLLKSICPHENTMIEFNSDLPICALVSDEPVLDNIWRAISCSDCGQNWREGNEP